MKKIFILMAGALLLASCAKEAGPSVAKAVLGDVSLMDFPAQNPTPKSVTIVSDGTWHVTAPSWIVADPSTGNGETVVTVTVYENMDEAGMLEPRKDTLFLSGNKLSSRHMIIVTQAGDPYRNAQHSTVSEIASLADGKSFILDEGVVVAVAGSGFVVSDGTVNVYVSSAQKVSVGDKVTLKGIKGTANGVPVVSQADACSVTEAGAFEYPEPLDLNEQIAAYTAASMDYVKASGIVSAGNLVVTAGEAEYVVKQIDAPAGMSLSALNGHKVTLWGYSYGILGAKMLGVLATKIQDDGLDQVIYFEDDFEWLAPWTANGVSDDVANNSVNTDGAPNVFGNAATYGDMIAKFQEIGYGFVWGWKGQDWSDGNPDNGNKRTLYLQKNYLKFGKTSYSSGLRTPALKAIEGTDDVLLSFDWCYCMTGTGLPDLTTLTLVIEGDGTFADTQDKVSGTLVSEQPIDGGGKTKLEWQHAEVRINGASATTTVTIRPTNSDPTVTNSARKQNRWYLDNIKVVPAQGGQGGGVKPGTTVLDEDFEWLAPYAEAAKAPDDVTDNKVGSSPNIMAVADLQPIMAALQDKGYGYIWSGKGIEGWQTSAPTDSNGQTLYLQKNYLKFGKTDYSSGLVLPAISALSGATNLELTFDWCWCMTGKSKPDIMTLTVEVDGVTTELTSDQPTEKDLTKLEWQHATVSITGATAESRIILRPTNTDPYVSNSARGQNRWYLDNIKIVTK